MEVSLIEKKLSKYVPIEFCGTIAQWIFDYKIKVRVTKARKTKLGDYRIPSKSIPFHQITVNKNLNTYAFTITLVHEIAHMLTYENHKHNVKPHGSEWKKSFNKLMSQLDIQSVFPTKLYKAVKLYLANPKASSCTDPNLMRELMKFNEEQITTLEELNINDVFEMEDGRKFVIEKRQRTRFRCRLIDTNKVYLVNGLAAVSKISEPSEKA
ncbi:MAG: SprT protein [Sphingobacteriales bacterium]|jgi:SprT protein